LGNASDAGAFAAPARDVFEVATRRRRYRKTGSMGNKSACGGYRPLLKNLYEPVDSEINIGAPLYRPIAHIYARD
jgi:hypothetical protein